MSETYMKIEDLLNAYVKRRRADWPEGFEVAMKHPLYSRLIRIQALHEEVRAIERHDLAERAVEPPIPAYTPRLAAHLERMARTCAAVAVIENKRLASGERESDSLTAGSPPPRV